MIHLLSQPPKLLWVQFIAKHILGSIVLQNSCGQGEVCREGIVCPARQKGWEHVCRQRERRSRMVTVPKCIKKRQGLLWVQKRITEERWVISADHCVNDPKRGVGVHQAVTRPENLDEFSQCTISFKIGESTHGGSKKREAPRTRAVVTVLKDLVSSQRQPCTSPISLSLSAQWMHKYANW